MTRKGIGIASGSIVCVGLLLGSSSAFAGSFDVNLNEILPTWQMPGWTKSQTKAISNQSGRVNIESVGSTYSVDAEMCKLPPSSCGAKQYNLRRGAVRDLGNGFAAGQRVVLQLRIHQSNWVEVQVTGAWHSN